MGKKNSSEICVIIIVSIVAVFALVITNAHLPKATSSSQGVQIETLGQARNYCGVGGAWCEGGACTTTPTHDGKFCQKCAGQGQSGCNAYIECGGQTYSCKSEHGCEVCADDFWGTTMTCDVEDPDSGFMWPCEWHCRDNGNGGEELVPFTGAPFCLLFEPRVV